MPGIPPLAAMAISPKPDHQTPIGSDDALRDAARKLEAGFLAEMLKSAGFGETPETHGGGAGEDQFASFLRHAQAEEMVKSGGIGLSEALFHALKGRSDAG